MADNPSAQNRLDALLAVTTMAHEAICDAYLEMVELGREDDRARALVSESAHITLEQWPSRLTAARDLAAAIEEQSLLAPEAIDKIQQAFEHALSEAAADLDRLAARQRQIHATLSRLVDDALGR